MKKQSNVAMIEVVARGLGAFKENVVFVGGATVALYINDKKSITVRPTDDVDCIIEITSRQNYHDIQAALEKTGFRHSMEERAPICRMDFKGLKVDIMPSDPRILGFSNIWYKDGMKHAIKTKLPNGDTIQIFDLPYFIASKIEAYLGRGQGDFRLSSDIEDVVTVLDAQKDFNGLLRAPESINAYLKKHLRSFISNALFLEALTAHLAPGPDRIDKVERLLDRLNSFCVGI